MITKQRRHGTEDKYDLKVTDKNNNTFIMSVGGNFDLYWYPDYWDSKNFSFYIDKSDSYLYDIFNQLFRAIRKNDDKYNPTMNGNVFTFISEDYHVDEANRLQIVKEDNQYLINFIRNDNQGIYSAFRRGCTICFCNSGSRVPKVEQQFMLLFNELAYYTDDIELEN